MVCGKTLISRLLRLQIGHCTQPSVVTIIPQSRILVNTFLSFLFQHLSIYIPFQGQIIKDLFNFEPFQRS